MITFNAHVLQNANKLLFEPYRNACARLMLLEDKRNAPGKAVYFSKEAYNAQYEVCNVLRDSFNAGLKSISPGVRLHYKTSSFKDIATMQWSRILDYLKIDLVRQILKSYSPKYNIRTYKKVSAECCRHLHGSKYLLNSFSVQKAKRVVTSIPTRISRDGELPAIVFDEVVRYFTVNL